MASAPLPFSAPNPRSLPTSVNQPLEIVLANWQAQLANLISVTPPQVTPTNFAVSNQRGGMSLSWSPVPSGDGYEILKSANGSFVDDLQIVPIKNPAQCSYFDGTGGAATKVSYRIRTTSGTAANPQSQRGPESGPIQHTSIAVTDTTASPTVKYDTSTTTQTQSLARKGNYGAFRLTGLGKSGGANAGTGGATTAGGGTGGGVVPPPTPTTECPWSGLFGDMTISQVAPWDGPNVGTPDTGISRDGVGSLAIGNGSTGDASGNLDLATILASSSVTAGVNATSAGTFVIANGGALGVSITLQNLGATTAYNFNLPTGPGAAGQALTSQAGGSSSMTWVSYLPLAGGTMTGVLTLEANAAGLVDASGSAGSNGEALIINSSGYPVWTVISNSWSSLTNPNTNLTLTMGSNTTAFNYATALAASWLWANTTPTVTGASTTVALSTGTAPVNSGGNVWVYTLAASESGAGSNKWVNAVVTLSGYTGGATGNNIANATITASTTTTITITNASGTTTNTGTPVMISSAVSSSPVLQIAGTVNTGTAGTLNSAADVWSIQNVIGSVAPNSTSTLTFTHSGSSGAATVNVPFLVVGAGTSPCSISSASAGIGYGIDLSASGPIYIIQIGAAVTEFNSGTTAIAVGAGACINWQNTTSPGNTANTDLLLSRVSPSVLGLGNVSTLGNFGGSLVSTGLNSDGGLLLQQFTTVVGTPTVTPATSGSTSYSYEVVALDINRQPIGVSAAGTTAAAASTITTTNSITVAWAAVAGAFAYAVYRSASGGTPSTTGLLSSSQTITAITTGTSTMVMTVASVTLNSLLVGQLLTVSGSSHSNNNGNFYCTAATATSITVFNPYAVAEASPPASAAFIGGVVPASTLSFKDSGFAANSVAAPSTNTSGSLGFVASYESATSGTALSQDFWSIYPVVASGLNGASTLTFTHSGSSGVAAVSVPQLVITTASGSISGNSCVVEFASGVTYVESSGTTNLALNKNSTYSVLNLISTGGLSWASGSPASTVADTTITRNAAGIVQIGTTGSNAAGTMYCARLDSSSADMQGGITSAPSGISCTAVTVAVGGATGTFTVTSTEEFVIGDTVTLSSTGWTASKGLNSSVATVASITNSTTLVLTYVSGGPWIAGTYTAQTGTLTQTGGTVASYTYATAYTNTPTVVVTPTSNCGAFYISSSSTTGFSITYANSGTQTFNYQVMGNPT